MPSSEDVHEALVLAELLCDRPDSHYRAELLGGPQFFGWSEDRALAVETHNILLTLAAGLVGEHLQESDLWPWPRKDEPEDQPTTIAEFNTAEFMRWLTG